MLHVVHFLPVLNHPLPLELFVYLRLIIGILSLCISAHLTVLPLFSPALNLTFSLLPITSSHPHASTSDSTFDFWRYVNIWLTFDVDILVGYAVVVVCCSCWQIIVVVVDWCTWGADQRRRWHADCLPHSSRHQPVDQSAAVPVPAATRCPLRARDAQIGQPFALLQ